MTMNGGALLLYPPSQEAHSICFHFFVSDSDHRAGVRWSVFAHWPPLRMTKMMMIVGTPSSWSTLCPSQITAVEDSATNTRKITILPQRGWHHDLEDEVEVDDEVNVDDEVDLEDEIDDRCTVLWDENNDRWRFYCWLRGRWIFSLEFRRRFVFL